LTDAMWRRIAFTGAGIAALVILLITLWGYVF
jgi:hypothetical protein